MRRRGGALAEGGSHTYAAAQVSDGGGAGLAATTMVRESPDGPEGLSRLQGSLPDTTEYWSDPDRPSPAAFRYLTALRQSPPGIKSFG